MRTLFRTTMLIVLALTLAAPCALAAGDQIAIESELDEAIFYLYLSKSSSDSWGDDILEDDVMYGGSTIRINFSRGITTRYWDLRIVTASGTEAVWTDIDLYTYSTLVIYEDRYGDIQAYGR